MFIYIHKDNFKDDIFPKTYIINLKHHIKRLEQISKRLNDEKIKFKVIDAVNANNIDEKTKRIFIEWPCLLGDRRNGTKALMFSNVKVYKHFLKSNHSSDWLLMLEDDAIIPKDFKKGVLEILKYNKNVLFINLDNRSVELKWGMSAVLVHRDILEFLIKESHPKTSWYMNNYIDRPFALQLHCNHDLYYNNLLATAKIPHTRLPYIRSGEFISSIQKEGQCLTCVKENS